jgi:tetratricopeptide (TPR) repeat protein
VPRIVAASLVLALVLLVQAGAVAPLLAQGAQGVLAEEASAPRRPAAVAPPFDGEPAEERVARARAHFVLGMQFFETRAYRDAIREFQLAIALVPIADVWFNIGRAHEELGDYERARAAFERYLRDRVDAPDAAAVRQRLSALAQRSADQARGLAASSGNGSLRIHAVPDHALVALDGRVVSPQMQQRPILLAAGRHRLEVARPGFIPFRAELSIESGLLTSAYPRLVPLTPPVAPPPEPARTWTWVALGLAGAGAITSATFGAVSLEQQSEGDVEGARAWSRRADVALAGTAVCALAAAVLYFVEAPSETPRARGARAAR